MTKNDTWTAPVLKSGTVSGDTSAGAFGAVDAGIFS